MADLNLIRGNAERTDFTHERMTWRDKLILSAIGLALTALWVSALKAVMG